MSQGYSYGEGRNAVAGGSGTGGGGTSSLLGALGAPSVAAAGAKGKAGPVTKPKKNPKDAKAGKGERKTRSRLACLPCKSTKQKCDGPSRVPCRRCELYGLECKFAPTPGVVLHPAPPPVPVPTPGGGDTSMLNQKLDLIVARLQSIESVLHFSQQHVNPFSGASPRDVLSSRSPSHAGQSRSPTPESSHGGMDQESDSRPMTTNPIQEINHSIETVVGVNESANGTLGEDYGCPDVLKRGVLTAEECQELFEFFFCSIHPWVMMLSLDEDRDAMGVYNRSKLLFHTVLAIATSYSTPFPSPLHTTILTFLHAILAPQILSPQPHELTTDFLRSIDLLNLYKPTQLAARLSEGNDETEAMRRSKVNGLASWMLQGILARTAERLELSSVCNKFARAYAASNGGVGIPAHIIRDLRLYLWLLCNDVHGNVQSGRRCNMDGTSALPVVRLLSALQLQPYDTRLAASTEMFEVARPILRSFSYERTRRISRVDLARYNDGIQAFEDHWVPILLRQLAVDPLAMTVMYPFAAFITLTYNATALVSWKQNRMYASDSGSEGVDMKPLRRVRTEGARGLTEWEFEGLEKCVRAAEALVFLLCEESRVPGAWRMVQWDEAAREDGWRKLTLDTTVVEQCRWGMDAIVCIAYIFPLVFLAKLVNEGILTPDLVLLHTPSHQPPWTHPQKFPRLLELGASFLDAITLNPHHPARAQAQVLRTLLDTGIKGSRLPTKSQLPRHASVVLSPAPSPLPPFNSGGGVNGGDSPRRNWSPSMMSPSYSGVHHQALPVHLTQQMHQQQQQQQQQQLTGSNPYMQQHLSPTHPSHQQQPTYPLALAGLSPAGQTLTDVLEGFDPLFESTSAFWEWGGMGGAGQGAASEIDWTSLAGKGR